MVPQNFPEMAGPGRGGGLAEDLEGAALSEGRSAANNAELSLTDTCFSACDASFCTCDSLAITAELNCALDSEAGAAEAMEAEREEAEMDWTELDVLRLWTSFDTEDAAT